MATRRTSAKKSAPKKPTRTSARRKDQSASAAAIKSNGRKVADTRPVQSGAPMRVRKSYLFFIVIAVVLLLLLLAFRGLFVAAVVNGQPISRVSVVKESEKQAGKQALNNLVRNALIEQEAKRENVTVSDKEIDDEIKKVENTLSKQGQKMDQVLAMQGLTREDLRKLIRLDKLVGKMVGKNIKVSDKDIEAYIEKNRDSLPQDQTEAQLRKTVGDTLRQQQLNQKVQTWLADLQRKAKIQYFVQY